MVTGLNVLVVEDHDMLREATVAMLRANGHHASGAMCAEEVDDHPSHGLPDLYVIDLSLPGQDGLSLARRLRSARPAVGIIMATARTRVDERVAGYANGADIYLPKPVDPSELLAAIAALGKRIRPVPAEAALRLQRDRLQLLGPLASVALSPSEAQLLGALAQAEGQTLERWQVAVHLSLAGKDVGRASLDVRLSQLRKKLHEAGAEAPSLRSIRNHGYRLCVPVLVD
ncbi:MAG: response regulator transcription factor [Burkholderiales bacterium]|nr:response regulator transcription factor [Burkholderiales bacterium]